MEVAVLGPVEARDGDVLLPISATRARGVLGLLALRVGTAVSSAEIIEALWGDDPPRSATKAVQMFISNLRRIVPVGTVVTTATGYRLDVRAEHVDARRFEQLSAQGRQLVAAASHLRAAELFDEALALWRGPALPELAGEDVGRAEATRLEELRRSCEEDLVDARLALGEHDQLAGGLEALVAAEPLRERRWAQLMLAHYRCGRQGEALRTYQRLRRVLDDELGIEPSAEVRALDDGIVRQDPSLAWSAAAAAPDGHDRRLGWLASTLPPGPVLSTATILVARFADDAGDGDDDGSETAATLPAPTRHRREPARNLGDVLRDTVTAHRGELAGGGTGELTAVFASSSEAVAAAVAMQQAAAHATRRRAAPPPVRIGLSTGEVTRDDGDYRGDPVAEAAGLCLAGGSGQIVAADVVRTTLPRRTRCDVTNLGAVAVPGLDEAVTAVLVDWRPLPPGEPDVPLPEPVARRAGAGFFGRAAELERLAEMVEAMAGDQRQTALVTGEPGIGKTTLAAVAGLRARRAGAVVLFGRCAEEPTSPYQPFVEALTHYIAHAPADVLDDHIASHGGELARLVPTLAQRIPTCPPPQTTDPDVERYLLFGAAAGLLATAGRDHPVVVILDDLHWADQPTLQLLAHLCSTPTPMAVLVLATVRSTEVASVTALAEVMSATGAFARLDLAGLGNEEVGLLTATTAGTGLDVGSADLVRALRRETGGNPFFVVEIVRHLVESGGLAHDREGHWHVDDALSAGLPQSVRQVVHRRVDRLGDDVRRLLAVAAVVGRDADLDVLVSAADESADTVEALVAIAEEAALVARRPDRPRTLSFSHTLVRQTLYEAMDAPERRATHGRVAAALEASPAALEASPGGDASRLVALAHHWSCSDHPARALTYARRAGELALGSAAPDEAVRCFALALELHQRHRPDDAAEHADLLVGLGTAQRVGGDPGHRSTLLEAAGVAHDLGDAELCARAVLACSRGFWSSAGEVDADKVGAVEAALALLPERDSPRRARLLAVLSNELTFGAPLERRVELAGQAREMSLRLGDAATAVHVLTDVSDAIWVPDTLDERLADSALALELAGSLADPAATYAACSSRLRAATESGLVDDADQCLDAMRRLASEVGDPAMRWRTRFAEACRALLAGDSASAERLSEDALDVGSRSGQPDAFTFYSAALYHVRWQQGRLGEVVPLLRAAIDDNPGIPGYQAALTRALVETGDHDEAGTWLARAAAAGFSHLPDDSLRSSALAMYADAAAELRSRRAARMLYRLMARWHNQFVYMGVALEGPTAHYLGALAAALGSHRSASAHFAESQEMANRTGSPFFAARTQLEWGRVLSARPAAADVELGRVLLLEARRTAQAHGYGAVERRADEALAKFVTHRGRELAASVG